MSDFAVSFDRLRAAIAVACDSRREWPAKVVAGIQAMLRFAAADPAGGRALTIVSRGGDSVGEPHQLMIEHFSAMLGDGAPAGRAVPISTERAIVNGIATIVGAHLRIDREADLRELAPDLAYFSLLPYLGFAEAKRWAVLTAESRT